MKRSFQRVTLIITLSSLAVPASFAATTKTVGYRLPRVTIQGMTGSRISGWSDAMVSLYNTPASMLYADGQLEGSYYDSFLASLGLGYRSADSNDDIWGGYLFVDRGKTGKNSEYYTMLSPGLEFLGKAWGARLNTYFPVGNTKHLTGSGIASSLGNTQFESFSGHDQIDRYQYNYDRIMDYGADFSLSYQYKAWKLSGGPYGFHVPGADSIIGGKVQLRYQVTPYLATFIEDRYDNKNQNRFIAGVSVSFGHGANQGSNALESRMMSPVYRNLDVNTTTYGMPVQKREEFSSTASIVDRNIYFIDNDTSSTSDASGTGTFEDPYTSISQIGDTPSDAKIWVADTGSQYSENGSVSLSGSQSLVGRTANFKSDAKTSLPTLKIDGLTMTNGNILKNLKILGNGFNPGGSLTTGITVNSGGNSSAVAQIDNVDLGANGATGFNTGILLNSNANLNVKNSTIQAYDDGNTRQASGITTISESGSLTVDNDTIIVNDNGDRSTAYGIFNDSGITVSNSTITVSANGRSNQAFAIESRMREGTITVSNSTLTAKNTYDEKTTQSQAAAFQNYDTVGDPTIHLINDTFNAAISNSDQLRGNAYAYGVDTGSGTTFLTNANFNVSGNSDRRGVEVKNTNTEGSGTIIIDNDAETGIGKYLTTSADKQSWFNNQKNSSMLKS